MLDHIRDKVEAGRRLSAEEGEYLFRPEVDLHVVGELADLVRRRRCGNVVYYNVNAHLNPTNVCRLRCPLCAYSRNAGESGAYELTLDEMVSQARSAAADGCTELHVVGGIHPDRPFAWYLDIVRGLREACPRLCLKAWTAVEIAWFAELEGCSVEAILTRLIDAGLTSLPGGGAEIFAPEVRQQICPNKCDAATWLAVHRAAHRLGLRTTATMLYGHVESPVDRVDHLIRLRALQDETGGFLTFIPLAFHPENTRLSHLTGPTGLDDLRVVSVARLLLDNFPHVKAYWISLGIGAAQTALAYGANDFDGTVRQERIHHEAGAQSPQVLSIDEIRALIEEAGRQPVERDTLYRRVMRSGGDWSVTE